MSHAGTRGRLFTAAEDARLLELRATGLYWKAMADGWALEFGHARSGSTLQLRHQALTRKAKAAQRRAALRPIVTWQEPRA